MKAMATQTKDTGLQGKFQKLHKTLSDNEAKINQDLIDCQGNAVDIGGYYHPDHKKAPAGGDGFAAALSRRNRLWRPFASHVL